MCNNEKVLIIVISSHLNICKGCFISMKKSAVNQKHQQNNSTSFTYYVALFFGGGHKNVSSKGIICFTLTLVQGI